MTKLTPILNPDHMPKGKMLRALTWLETWCRIREERVVSEDYVRAFLLKQGGQALADKFKAQYLLEPPRDPE